MLYKKFIYCIFHGSPLEKCKNCNKTRFAEPFDFNSHRKHDFYEQVILNIDYFRDLAPDKQQRMDTATQAES